MMEYVVLLMLVALPVMMVLYMFDFSKGEYVYIGKDLAGFFQRLTSSISLPIP